MTATVEIAIPEAYPLQDSIVTSHAKRKVICAGRRAGKTTLAAMLAIEAMLDGKKILLTSTTQDQADAFWDKVKPWLWPLFERKLATKNEGRRIIEFNGGRIRVKTGSDPDVLRGADCDLLVLDECALLDPQAWDEVGAPMLADRDGDAVFISTPRRRNWFYLLYTKARMQMLDGDPRWQAWNFSSLENPHLSKPALDELTHDMSDEAYKQEILAEFLPGQGIVFRRVRECAQPLPAEPYAGDFVAGVDWAMQQDYTVITVIDRATRKVVDIDRFNRVDWALQRARIMTMRDKWKPRYICCEINSIGSPNFEALQREGLPVVAFETTASSKPPLIESLVLAFERGEIGIPDNPILIGELEAYERKVSPTTGRSAYSAPDGMHDDMVMALALAWREVMRGVPSSSRNPFFDEA